MDGVDGVDEADKVDGMLLVSFLGVRVVDMGVVAHHFGKRL
jgi:hypothetical protein